MITRQVSSPRLRNSSAVASQTIQTRTNRRDSAFRSKFENGRTKVWCFLYRTNRKWITGTSDLHERNVPSRKLFDLSFSTKLRSRGRLPNDRGLKFLKKMYIFFFIFGILMNQIQMRGDLAPCDFKYKINNSFEQN